MKKEIDSLNRSITSDDLEVVTKKNVQQTKVQDWTDSQGNVNKYLRRTNIYSNKIKKIEDSLIHLILKN